MAVMLVCASTFLGGCAVSGNALPDIADGNQLITGSVATQVKPKGIEEADAELIKSTVSTANPDPSKMPLAWSNPETGSSGAIVAIDSFMGKHGQKCRGFKTTVANFMGVAFYNGETCQLSAGEWVLSWFKAAS